MATIAVCAYVWSTAQSQDRLRFDSQVRRTVTALDKRLDTYVDILIGGAGLFAASENVSAEEFARYVNALRIQDRYPGIQGIGFSAFVPLAARDSLVLAQRRAGFTDFRSWPDPQGEELHAIVYLIPQDARNQEAMGFDMSSNPVRREAMARARDTGGAAASGRVTLVQEIDEDIQPGFLIYVPVYRGPGVPTSIDERRERLRGFVYSPFRARDLLEELSADEAAVEFEIYDGSNEDAAALLFDSGGIDGGSMGHDARLRSVVRAEVAGHTWTVAVSSGSMSSGRRLATFALGIGLLVSAALFFLTAAEADAHDRAERTAQSLLASETQYRLAFEQNPHPMWIYDIETLNFLAVNDAAMRHYGYSREEFMSMSVTEIRPLEDMSDLRAHVARVPADDASSSTWRHVKRDGSVIIVEVSSNPLDFAGRHGRLVLAHDVTARVLSRRELEEAQDRLQRILRMSTAVIYTMDIQPDGLRYTWVTENLARLTGYSVAEGLAPGWWDERIHPDDRPDVVSTARTLLESGHRTVEYRFLNAKGDYIWIRDDAKIRFDEEGQPVEVIGAWLEVTELRRLEEQFQQAQKMEAVGRLAGGIAHDFNNILTVIRSQSELLLMDLPPGPVSAEIEVIQESANRATRLTGQLLAFSRHQFLVPQLLDATEVIRDLGKLLVRTLGADISLVYDLPDDLPPIEVDRGQLEQALINLAVNARDAMPAGGTLTFAANQQLISPLSSEEHRDLAPGRYVVLYVADDGVGMDVPTQSKIFEPFFTTKPSGKGTGLGLAMVYGFLRQSSGAVTLKSEPGQGTTFFLHFPAAEGQLAAASPTPPPIAGAAPMAATVLLVEDEESVRRAMRRILERSGITVVDVASAEAALEVLEGGDGYDLVITDLVLPAMSGWEFADRLRARAPHLPLIIISGYDEGSTRSPTELPGNSTFVRKPFTMVELLTGVQEALRA